MHLMRDLLFRSKCSELLERKKMWAGALFHASVVEWILRCELASAGLKRTKKLEKNETCMDELITMRFITCI